MARPRKPALTASRLAFAELKPKLPRYYGIHVHGMFPGIDLRHLYMAVAGRIEYDEGLAALRTIVKLHTK